MQAAVAEDRNNLGLQQKVSDTMISKNGPMNVGMIIAAAFAQQDLPASELAARDRLPQNTAEAVQWIWNVASGFAHGYSVAFCFSSSLRRLASSALSPPYWLRHR